MLFYCTKSDPVPDAEKKKQMNRVFFRLIHVPYTGVFYAKQPANCASSLELWRWSEHAFSTRRYPALWDRKIWEIRTY